MRSSDGFCLPVMAELCWSEPRIQPPSLWLEIFGLLSLTVSGGLVFDETIGGSGDDRAFGDYRTADGDFLIGGQSDSWSPGDYNGLIVRVGPNGEVEWARTFGGTRPDRISDAVETVDGGLVLVGYTKSLGSATVDAWVLKVTQAGMVGTPCLASQLPRNHCAPSFSSGSTPSLITTAVPDSYYRSAPDSLSSMSMPDTLLCQVRPPGEVSGPTSMAPLIFTSREDLQWEEGGANNANVFNLYRGNVALLSSGGYGTCFAPNLVANSGLDIETPTEGSAWFYLVTGRNAFGEGTMGEDSNGNERPNLNPCP